MEKIKFPELVQAEYEEKRTRQEKEEQLRREREIDNMHLDNVVGELAPYLTSFLKLYARHVKAQEDIARALDENL